MLSAHFVFTVLLVSGALCFAIALPPRDEYLQSLSRSVSDSHEVDSTFSSGETVFGIAQGLNKLQEQISGLHQLSRDRNQQVITQDSVSTHLQVLSTGFNLTVSGNLWGYNQKAGYYQFANGTTSTDKMFIDIGNDIACLSAKDLMKHILTAVKNLNDLTYPLLDSNICGGTREVYQVLDPLRSSESMTAIIAKASTGVTLSLNTGIQINSVEGAASMDASTMAFITTMNNGIVQRISEQGFVDYVDAFIVEVYLALAHPIAEQAATLMDGDCVSAHDAVAGMNALDVVLGGLLRTKSSDELQEL